MLTRHQAATSAKFIQPEAKSDDRRRRPRLSSDAVGYLLLDSAETEEPWEVRVNDVSRLGVGFITSERLQPGTICRIRIGYGPMRLARRMRVTRCEPLPDNTFRTGAEFA